MFQSRNCLRVLRQSSNLREKTSVITMCLGAFWGSFYSNPCIQIENNLNHLLLKMEKCQTFGIFYKRSWDPHRHGENGTEHLMWWGNAASATRQEKEKDNLESEATWGFIVQLHMWRIRALCAHQDGWAPRLLENGKAGKEEEEVSRQPLGRCRNRVCLPAGRTKG